MPTVAGYFQDFVLHLIFKPMQTFLHDVVQGLSATPKSIPSRYLYDEEGSRLFQQIMQLKEYYLPDAEMEIIDHQTETIIDDLTLMNNRLDVIELGAGDGTKTLSFLQLASKTGVNIHYYPLDISPEILKSNSSLINRHLPSIQVSPLAGNFFDTLSNIPGTKNQRLVLFMGSNIGNLTDKEIANLLEKISSVLNPPDAALIAFDLKKCPHTILRAYNDSKGITRAFNLNLLHRINRELHADFDVSRFEHYPVYDPVSGSVHSYLISQREQKVRVHIDNHTFQLASFEPIQTEISRKFSLSQIEKLCSASGFDVTAHYTTKKQNYAVTLMKLQ
jgi:L-histidine Nalpha-methyltransferase